jgi:hypothetical protein
MNDIVFRVIVGSGIVLVIIGIVTIIVTGEPIIAEGYEDKDGFHYGKPPKRM